MPPRKPIDQTQERIRKTSRKKSPSPLDAERQALLRKYVFRWLERDKKNRTQGNLLRLAGVHSATLSDALSSSKITTPMNALRILRVVASPKETIVFIVKYLPELREILEWLFKSHTKSNRTIENLMDFIEAFWDEASNLRKDVQDIAKIIAIEFVNSGRLEKIDGKSKLKAGKTSGILIQVSDKIFHESIEIFSRKECVEIGGHDYELINCSPDFRAAVLKEIHSEKLIYFASDGCPFFEIGKPTLAVEGEQAQVLLEY